MSLNTFCSKCWTDVSLKMLHQLFSMKIHAKCFQITDKTMTLPILKITNINKGPLTLSVLPWENLLMKNRNFHGAIKLKNKVFAGFNRMKFCLSGEACFSSFWFAKRSEDNLI